MTEQDKLGWESVKVVLEDILLAQKAILRRLGTQDNVLNDIFKDREIMEDTQGSISNLKSLIITGRQHQDLVSQGLKADVNSTQSQISDKVEEVKGSIKDAIDKKTVIIKSTREPVFVKVLKKFGIYKKEQK